jgi:hypothetical protein
MTPEDWKKKCIMWSFITCALHQIYLEQSMLKRMRLARYVACTEERNAHGVAVGKPYGKRPSGRTILKWMLEKLNGVIWTGFI